MECVEIFDIGGSYPYHCGYTSTSRHGLKVSIYKMYHINLAAPPSVVDGTISCSESPAAVTCTKELRNSGKVCKRLGQVWSRGKS